MTTHDDPARPDTGGAILPSAAEMRSIIEDGRRARLAEKERAAKAAEDEKTHRKELFLSSSLTPETIDRIMGRVRSAAGNGESEILLGHFPSDWCTDGGRKINAREDGWPDTLQGVAREFYEFWQQDLKAKGFVLSVEIISFPGGMPGDVGVTLAWGA
ncbi:hypothetical protein ABMY26_08925 [Azospirillum sp. HJ39]|uniref:hypothetical protein n=1 Tax=Azospirillum sp. HJ39 TaxID=3159496 RepID=UPI003556C16E